MILYFDFLVKYLYFRFGIIYIYIYMLPTKNALHCIFLYYFRVYFGFASYIYNYYIYKFSMYCTLSDFVLQHSNFLLDEYSSVLSSITLIYIETSKWKSFMRNSLSSADNINKY